VPINEAMSKKAESTHMKTRKVQVRKVLPLFIMVKKLKT
jgi:hypothetical protein